MFIAHDLWGNLWGNADPNDLAIPKRLKNMVSAAGFEPATHALKGLSERQINNLH